MRVLGAALQSALCTQQAPSAPPSPHPLLPPRPNSQRAPSCPLLPRPPCGPLPLRPTAPTPQLAQLNVTSSGKPSLTSLLTPNLMRAPTLRVCFLLEHPTRFFRASATTCICVISYVLIFLTPASLTNLGLLRGRGHVCSDHAETQCFRGRRRLLRMCCTDG